MHTQELREKSERFHQLHHNGQLLVLPNIWDPFGAILLQDLGYPAVATSSSAMSWSQGFRDGEKLPFDALLLILKRIVQCVKIPVTADVETAYAANNLQLKDHIKKLIDTGIAGINFEDSRQDQPGLVPIEAQCEKINSIKKASIEAGSPLFLNARVDTYIKANYLTDEEKLKETLIRGKAYKAAGADGLYPILLKDQEPIKVVVQQTGLPVNLTMIPGLPDFEQLKTMGVARVSLASGFFKSAAFALKQTAETLLKNKNLNDVFQHMETSGYIQKLIP